MSTIRITTVTACALVLVSCASDNAEEKPSSTVEQTTEPAPARASPDDTTREKGARVTTRKSGIDLSRFDRTVRPQDDFYRFVNGTWLRTFEIPADKSNYGTFTKLADDAEANLKKIIEESAEGAGEPGTDRQKVGHAYLAFMDEARIESLGATPLDPLREQIAAAKSADDVVRLIGALGAQGVNVPVLFYVDQDAKDSTSYIGHLYQGGLGLPDRDYYLKDDFKEPRAAYEAHIATVFGLLGAKDGAARAKKIMAIETALATAQWTRVDSRDAEKTYNKLSKADLKAKVKLNVDALLGALELPEAAQAHLVVAQPSYLEGLAALVKKTPVADWKSYLELRVADALAPVLAKAFADEHFAFYEKTLSGVSEQRPRWKRGVALVESGLGFALGKIYVERHFPPKAKQRMAVLVENLKRAFAASIDGLEWMGPETKKAAHEKLAKFVTKIGAPDKWRDYSALEIKADDVVGNTLRADLFEHRRNVAKLGTPVDRGEWYMTPQTVNAYYNSSMNEIVFPAAILQPPFFDMDADDAVNYGAIGAVIGHELGHGFDDQGRKSDGDGNLRDWWTADDAQKFKTRADLLVEQYSGYVPIDDLHVNGELTLGENIGDLGGMNIAYKAYVLSLDDKDAPVIDEFTGAQRFFIGWSQIWGRKYRDAELRRRLVTDPHSPSEQRVNAVVANMPEFYAAFDVKDADKLYRAEEKRVKIW